MSLPPFPSQDLAKLVLGYLAEEQLMTVYDEFLQASPYLDALRNEYDRIFMTSLKSILAEYRAVKIYVETLKPYALRKKIFQCSNLLDIVKFLVTNIDINKIQLQEAIDKASIEKHNINITEKTNSCSVCLPLKLASCACKAKDRDTKDIENVSVHNVSEKTYEASIETTPLESLPGSHVTKRQKKNIKPSEKDIVNISFGNSDASVKQNFNTNNTEENLSQCSDSPLLNTDNSSLNVTVKAVDVSKSNQNIEEFNNVLKSVVYRNKTLSGSECTPNQRVSSACTFQEFASGVSSGESQSATYNVPDSSTSENVHLKLTQDYYHNNTKGPPKSQLMLQVSHINDNIEIQTCRGDISNMKPLKPHKVTKIQPKPTENKIKIISDIKVDGKYKDKKKDKSSSQTSGLQNATSTPLMPMQTIVINGTPAYKHTPKSQAYTEDEIMAMPTLIVVPASGSSQIPTSAHCQPIMAHSCSTVSQTNSPPKVLGPLVIDVPSSAVTSLPNVPDLKSQEHGLVKTVDFKNGSVPKDNVTSLQSKTPQALPPVRKSSSTPRRTSHVRVLDFNTPRRILHETINEQPASESNEPPVEVVVTKNSSKSAIPSSSDVFAKSVSLCDTVSGNDNRSIEENDTNKSKPSKKDWDADLRALIGASGGSSNITSRKRTSRKRKSMDSNARHDSKTEDKHKSQNKKTPRGRKPKDNQKCEEEVEVVPSNLIDLEPKKDVPIKPTINIISAHSHTHTQGDYQECRNIASVVTNKYPEEVADSEVVEVDTPETERLSLQNVIGAKLNISDLLETPYKQALYDIQMETPKFMGPDFPGEPLSDVKIMSIPTPRFLNTPKAVQATPSSYSSRPTDYSSGGSYYKPDDQDYPIPEVMICPVTSTKEDSVEKSFGKESDERKPRPIRQCTKNVSYYKTLTSTSKIKDFEDGSSSCSETTTMNISSDPKCKKELATKTPKREKKLQNRSRTNKSANSHRKGKSPRDGDNDKVKSSIKIKPRYTPKKEIYVGKTKRRAIESPHSKRPSNINKKRTISKEKVPDTPLVKASPTKSRRKSSTPRKLHCTKPFNSESSGHDSPETVDNSKPHVDKDKINIAQDSDTEQLALRWSDDGSQDGKTKNTTSANDTEDITKIQEFIESSNNKNLQVVDPAIQEKNINNPHISVEGNGNLQRDLMKRGFDLETAKIIERDLLDDTPISVETTGSHIFPIPVETDVAPNKNESTLEKTIETTSTNTTELQIVGDDVDEVDIVLSVSESYEGTSNYIVYKHDDTKEISQEPSIKLKDKFTMEVCIDDDLTVRLRATTFSVMLDQDPLTVDAIDYSYKETERAVSSISNMDRLYTPLKESLKAQCYEIFDSTLTSLDTPLKATPMKDRDTTVTSLVLKEHKEAKDTDIKKRKRLQSGSDESTSGAKRAKQDADILFQTANIQNIDIESVLTKLHGP